MSTIGDDLTTVKEFDIVGKCLIYVSSRLLEMSPLSRI